MSDTDVTIYKRVDGLMVEMTVARDELAYIVVDHQTRKVVCGSTEEKARQNLHRLRCLSQADGH